MAKFVVRARHPGANPRVFRAEQIRATLSWVHLGPLGVAAGSAALQQFSIKVDKIALMAELKNPNITTNY